MIKLSNPKLRSDREWEIWLQQNTSATNESIIHYSNVDGNPHGTDHVMLDAVLQADDTSTSTVAGKHVTDALVKKYEDHRSNDALDEHSQYLLLAGRTGQRAVTPLILGGATNNTTVEEDGTVVFNGDAVVWDDIVIPLLSQRAAAANNPSLATFVGNVAQYTFAVNDYLYIAQEMLHSYKQGTDLDIHIHWATNGSEGTAKYVKWELEYTIANMSETAPFTAFPTATVISNEIEIPANTADRAHIYSDIGLITGTGFNIGAIIVGRLRRIAATGAAPLANPFGLQMGIHFQKDTVGSRQETSK